MNIIYVVAAACGSLFGVLGLLFRLRNHTVLHENRITTIELRVDALTSRLDRDREDSRDWRQKMETAMTEQTRLLVEISRKVG